MKGWKLIMVAVGFMLVLSLGSGVSYAAFPSVSSLDEPTDPSTYAQGKEYEFNSTIFDADGSSDLSHILFEWDGTNYTHPYSPQQNGLVGYWKFFDNATNQQDVSGNSNSGTFSGETFNDGTLGNATVGDSAEPTWTTGKYGNALEFVAVENDYVRVADDASLDITNAITVGAWVKLDGISNQRFVNKWASPKGWILELNNGKYTMWIDTVPGSAESAQTTVGVETGVWHHLVGKFDGTDIKLYVDGNLEATHTHSSPGDITTNNYDLGIGVQTDGWNAKYFNGSIDEVRIYDRSLSSSEISQIYENNTHIRDSLVSEWRFEEGTGSTAHDTHNLISPYNSNNKYGYGMEFDGEDDYVEVADDASLEFGDKLTITGWVNPKEFKNEWIVSKMTRWSSGWRFGTNEDGDVKFRWYGSSGFQEETTPGVLSTYTWQFVAVVLDSNYLYLYHNGNKYTFDTTVGDIINSSNQLKIGSEATEYFNGTIDDVMVFDRALTGNEIEKLYNHSRYRFVDEDTEEYTYRVYDQAAGTYTYGFHANDTFGNSDGSTSTFTIDKQNVGTLHLELNGSESNLTVDYNTATNVTAWSSDGKSGRVYLYRDSSLEGTFNSYENSHTGDIVNGTKCYDRDITTYGTTYLSGETDANSDIYQNYSYHGKSNKIVIKGKFRGEIIDYAGCSGGSYNCLRNRLKVYAYNYSSESWKELYSKDTCGDFGTYFYELTINDTENFISENNPLMTRHNHNIHSSLSTGCVAINDYEENATFNPKRDYTILDGGLHNYTASYEHENYTVSNNPTTHWLTVNKIASTIKLWLNNLRGHNTKTSEESINLTADLETATDITDTVKIFKDDMEYDSSNNPLINTSSFSTGEYEITANWTGNENYTTDNETWHLFIWNYTTCDYSNGNRGLTYFLKDEVSENAVTGTVDTTLNVTRKDKSPYPSDEYEYSFDLSGSSNYSFCLYPSGYVFGTTKELVYTADGYSTRRSYLSNATLNTSNPMESELSLLNKSESTLVDFVVKNPSAEPVSGVVVKFQRYWPGTGTYTIVASDTTGSEGTGLVYLNIQDIKYRIILEKNNVVLRSYAPQFIDCSSDPCLSLETAEEYYEGWWDYSDKIGHSCRYKEDSTLLVCDVTDTSGLTGKSCLDVDEVGIAGNIDVQNTCDSGSSVTLTYNVTTNKTYSYKLTTYFTNGRSFVFESGIIGENPAASYGMTGVVMALLVFLALSLFGVYNPTASIIFGTAGLIISVWMGLIIISGASLGALVLVAAVLVWRMKS